VSELGPIDWLFSEKSNKTLEKWIVYLCIFGLAYSAFLIFLPKPPVNFSILYLDPNSYSNYLDPQGMAHFKLGIENHEEKALGYEVKIFAENLPLEDKNLFIKSKPLAQKTVFVDQNKRTEENFSVFVTDRNFSEPIKIKAETLANGQRYSVHFWVKEKK
jgi:hypothetical protein